MYYSTGPLLYLQAVFQNVPINPFLLQFIYRSLRVDIAPYNLTELQKH